MAKSSDKLKIITSIDRVSLREFGYLKSGQVNGDPDTFTMFLENIVNGDLVDENYKGLTEDQKTDARTRVKELETEYKDISGKNKKFEDDIKTKEQKIEKHRDDLLKIKEDQAASKELFQNESFSPLKFWVSLFLILGLTFYLFFFYVSTAYKALYTDLDKLANSIADGLGTGSIMPQTYELVEALQFNFLLLLVPFVFYAFGWAFHIILDLQHRFKFVFLGLLVTVTFVVDFLMAMIIHNNIEEAKQLMGLSEQSWVKSPTFYIILFLGFVVYILWSIVLDSMLREWNKKRATLNIHKIIKHLKKDVAKLQKDLIPIDELKAEIKTLNDSLNTKVYGDLKSYIDQFSAGWLSFLTPESMSAVKMKCLDAKKNFEEKYKILPGLVKVIKR